MLEKQEKIFQNKKKKLYKDYLDNKLMSKYPLYY